MTVPTCGSEQRTPVVRLLTVADLAVLPSDLPSGSVRYELDNGTLVVLPCADDKHGAAVANLSAELLLQGEQRGYGRVSGGGVGLILRRNPDRVVGADVLFAARGSLPVRCSPEDYLETIPEVVVEVCGTCDTPTGIARKVAEYLTAGVQVVWVADPAVKTVTVHRANQPTVVLGENDTLTIEDIIPGFRVAVRGVFQE